MSTCLYVIILCSFVFIYYKFFAISEVLSFILYSQRFLQFWDVWWGLNNHVGHLDFLDFNESSMSREVDSQISNRVPISIWNVGALNSPVKLIAKLRSEIALLQETNTISSMYIKTKMSRTDVPFRIQQPKAEVLQYCPTKIVWFWKKMDGLHYKEPIDITYSGPNINSPPFFNGLNGLISQLCW